MGWSATALVPFSQCGFVAFGPGAWPNTVAC